MSSQPSLSKSSAMAPPPQADGVQAQFGGYVVETRNLLFRLKTLRRHQKLRRNMIRILAESHVGQIQEPPGRNVVGLSSENFRKILDRLARAVLLLVNSASANRQNTAFGIAMRDAVLGFSQAQVCDCELEDGFDEARVRQCVSLQKMVHSLLVVTQTQFVLADEQVQPSSVSLGGIHGKPLQLLTLAGTEFDSGIGILRGAPVTNFLQ